MSLIPGAGTRERNGGDVVVECLVANGVTTVIGLPGQHALPLFDALGRSELRMVIARTELNAAFMADGHARATGRAATLVVSTGPGALATLPALMEATSSSIPIVVLSAQIPLAGLGGGRHGYLHELERQSDAFQQVVKSAVTVRNVAQIASAIDDARRCAEAHPAGPVLVELPEDVLAGRADGLVPVLTEPAASVAIPEPRPELVTLAAQVLADSRSPVILAGGGTARSGAGDVLIELAEMLDAPVFSTFSGREGVPSGHELVAGSWMEDPATTRYLDAADVLLVVGSGLGELSTNYHSARPSGTVVQIDADGGVLGANHAVIGIRADARAALTAIRDRLDRRSSPDARSRRLAEIAAVRHEVEARLAPQRLDDERDLLEAVRRAVPAEAHTFWDMTILAYWAWSAWDRQSGGFASAQGAGGLGYAFPAALGFALDSAHPVLAVSGDGGAMYGISEFATAADTDADLTWLIVDDGAYGVLDHYMVERFGSATATRLSHVDFVATARAAGVRATEATPATLESVLAHEMHEHGPGIVVLRTRVRLFASWQQD